jgi:hypothetical protein
MGIRTEEAEEGIAAEVRGYKLFVTKLLYQFNPHRLAYNSSAHTSHVTGLDPLRVGILRTLFPGPRSTLLHCSRQHQNQY